MTSKPKINRWIHWAGYYSFYSLIQEITGRCKISLALRNSAKLMAHLEKNPQLFQSPNLLSNSLTLARDRATTDFLHNSKHFFVTETWIIYNFGSLCWHWSCSVICISFVCSENNILVDKNTNGCIIRGDVLYRDRQ